MEQQITIIKTDAVDEVMALTEGRTAPFRLPKLRGGIFLRVYDTAARGTEYAADCGRDWPGDFVIEAASAGDRRLVRIAATPGSPLLERESIYVVTAGNIWQESAAVAVYGEEDEDDA